MTHDFTHARWGHSTTVLRTEDGGRRIKLCGWGAQGRQSRPESGDLVVLRNKAGSTRYRLETVKPGKGTTDQWFAWAVFAPRSMQPDNA